MSSAIRTTLILVALLPGCAANDEASMSFSAHAGDPCTKCETCSTPAKSCICTTCTDYASDKTAKVLLVCTDRGWEVYKKCPGGVSAACADGAYKNSCLDESGKEVP